MPPGSTTRWRPQPPTAAERPDEKNLGTIVVNRRLLQLIVCFVRFGTTKASHGAVDLLFDLLNLINQRQTP